MQASKQLRVLLLGRLNGVILVARSEYWIVCCWCCDAQGDLFWAVCLMKLRTTNIRVNDIRDLAANRGKGVSMIVSSLVVRKRNILLKLSDLRRVGSREDGNAAMFGLSFLVGR
jgi:hypothetical protein